MSLIESPTYPEYLSSVSHYLNDPDLDFETKFMINERLDRLKRQQELRWIYAQEYHRTDKNLPLEFDDRHYLTPIYQDNSQEIVIRKCVQVGITEWAICETLRLCELGYSVFYVLPKYLIRNTFVSNRIHKTFNRVKYYQDMVKNADGESDSMSMIHYGKGTVKFASSETISDFGEFPADAWIVDEWHDCNPENILLCDDRISASNLKLRRRIGNPIFSESGIDAEFARSDRKHWFIRCEYCGHRQCLDMFKHVVRQTDDKLYELLDSEWYEGIGRDIHVLCEHCHKPIDRLAKGEWIAEVKSNVSGYAMSKLFTPTTTIQELSDKLIKGVANLSLLQAFYNRDLGLPFTVSGGTGFDDEVLDACISDYRMPDKCDDGIVTMGVDVGLVLNVWISQWEDEKRKVIYLGTCRDFESLDELIKRYGVKCCVIDARPETRKATEFQEKHKRGLVWICEYPNMSVEKQAEKIIPDRDNYIVKVDRTSTLDDQLSSFQTIQTLLPVDAKSIPDFFDQMKGADRVLQERGGKDVYVWVKKKADHYLHAGNYDMIAKSLIKLPGRVRFLR